MFLLQLGRLSISDACLKKYKIKMLKEKKKSENVQDSVDDCVEAAVSVAN